MNSDPRLEFGMGTPVLRELAPPDVNELLRASKEPMRAMLGVEKDEDWQVCRSPKSQSLVCVAINQLYTNTQLAKGSSLV